MAHALSDSWFLPTNTQFEQSERELGDNGFTIGHLGWTVFESRTPFQSIQIDFTGLERFSIDLADKAPELFDLMELMNEQMIQKFRCILKTKASQIKLWENLSIETMGPAVYREYLTPLYNRIFDTLEGSGKKLMVHYDGKLALIANDIKLLPFNGMDSLTPPPEGDITISEARKLWPDKFFWLHPSLSWFNMPEKQLAKNIKQMIKDAGPVRYCLMISEDIPPNWQKTIPFVLDMLNNL